MRGRRKTTGEHMRDGTLENCRHAKASAEQHHVFVNGGRMKE